MPEGAATRSPVKDSFYSDEEMRQDQRMAKMLPVTLSSTDNGAKEKLWCHNEEMQEEISVLIDVPMDQVCL